MRRPTPLFQLDDGSWNLIMEERILALFRQMFHPGGDQGIVRHLERKLIDQEAAQGLAGDIDTLPEGAGRKQDRMNLFFEFAQQDRFGFCPASARGKGGDPEASRGLRSCSGNW